MKNLLFSKKICPLRLTFWKNVLLYLKRNNFSENEMTAIRVKNNAPFRTRKRILSFNYIPAGT